MPDQAFRDNSTNRASLADHPPALNRPGRWSSASTASERLATHTRLHRQLRIGPDTLQHRTTSGRYKLVAQSLDAELRRHCCGEAELIGSGGTTPCCRIAPTLDRETATGSHTVKEDVKSHLLVGNSEVGRKCNGMDHTPWTSMLRLTKINCALLVTTCRLSV